MATVVFGDKGVNLANDPSYGALDPAHGAVYESTTTNTAVLRGTDGSKDIFKGAFTSTMVISGEWYATGPMTAYERYFPDGQIAYSVTGLRQEIATFIFESHQLATTANAMRQKQTLFSGSDTFQGGAGNDVFIVTMGNDVINGGAGIDTLYFDGSAPIYKVGEKSYRVSGSGYDNTFNDIERVIYRGENGAMKGYSTDVDGNAGQAYRLYQAAFDRQPDAAGLGTWINYLDSGHTLQEVSAMFQRSEEFVTRYGANPSNDAFVNLLYQNVLHRAPDAAGHSTWINILETGQLSRADVLIGFSESVENKAALIGVIQGGIAYEPPIA